jgi:iron(III) transport system substrate-binding protein
MPRTNSPTLVSHGFPYFRLTLVVAATTFFLILMGCNKTQSGPTLFAYVSMEEDIGQRLLTGFEKDTGIRVDFVRLSTGEAAARLEAEKNNPQSSVWLGGVGLGHAEAKEKGLTEPYESAQTKKIPPQYRDPENYWHGIYQGVLAFAANNKELESRKLTPPQTWKDLTDPKWKNLIQLPNPGTSGTSYNLITTLIKRDGEKSAFDYLHALHGNVSQYTKSGAAPTKNVALGESVIGVGYSQDILRLIHESKANIRIIYPTDGTGFEVAAVSLIKNGKQPDLAKKLVDWLYTPSAGQILAKHFTIPVVQDGFTLPPETALPKTLKLIASDISWAGKNKRRLVEMWNERVNQ